MNAEFRKRLIEAAEKYITPDDIPYYHKDVKQGFIAGVEHGYKEAITLAKEWLEKHGKHDQLDLVEFDMEMNKPWEEKPCSQPNMTQGEIEGEFDDEDDEMDY